MCERRDRLYIDTQTGALVRWHRETTTDLGNLPDETGGDDAFGFTVFPISYAYNGALLWNSLGAS